MQSSLYRITELALLFIVFPLTLVLNYPIWIKGLLGLLGFVYVIWVLWKTGKSFFSIKKQLPWNSFWRRIAATFFLIVITTSLYVYAVAPEKLFYVPTQKPLLFLAIIVGYSLFSVWPQEFLYRTFFFKRYEDFFNSKMQLVFVNAILFSLAHLFFRNTLVILLTFMGGILFGMSYFTFRSTLLVTIEHAIYGNWLFAVGMGEMLAFPGMEG